MNKCSIQKKFNRVITMLALSLLYTSAFFAFILNAPGSAAAQTSEVYTAKPFTNIKTPLYPLISAEDSPVIYADKNKNYNITEFLSDGFIVKINGRKYIAGGNYFALSFLVENNNLKTAEIEVNSTLKSESAKLFDEISKAELIFGEAERQSFYSLAFILFLNSKLTGAALDKLQETLKDFNIFISKQKSKKGKNAFYLEILSEYLNKINIKSRYIAGARINPLILKQALLFSRAVVIQSTSENPNGDILVFYNVINVSNKKSVYEYYKFNGGIETLNGLEILPVLVNSNQQYLIIF